MDFEELLESIRRSGPERSLLYGLSNLSGEELSRLNEVWPSWPAEHRRLAISRMVEIAEADFEADFCEVFKVGLRDEDPHVRAAAIEGLWEVEDIVLIRPLIKMMRDDDSALVREAAAISLSRFALLAELGRLQEHLGRMIWDALWETIHSPQEELDVRRRAVESLAYFDRPEVRPVIERAYNDQEPKMRISAIFAMGRSADESWGETVLDELTHDDPEVRYEAARACGALRVAAAVPILSRMVADPDAEVKLMAVWALGQIGGPEARRVLEICHRNGDEALQDAAEEALSELEFMEGTLDLTLFEYNGDERDW